MGVTIDPKRLARLYTKDHIPVALIAAQFETDPASVWRALARRGIALRGRSDTRTSWADVFTADHLRQCLAAGMSWSAIERADGASKDSVREHAARHGLWTPSSRTPKQLEALRRH